MKRRFITKYILTDVIRNDGSTVWGTCPMWVKEIEAWGYEVIVKERILWIGKTPACSACSYGGHVVL